MPLMPHEFRGAIALGCSVPGCGRGFTDDIHIEPGVTDPYHSPMDTLLTQFPLLLDMIIKTKRTESVRTDIARLAAALIISGKESPNTAVDTACYLYERIEAATADWGIK